jgi:hypothetical protein
MWQTRDRIKNTTKIIEKPIPVAVRSKAWVCGHSTDGNVASKPTGAMDIFLLSLLCVV